MVSRLVFMLLVSVLLSFQGVCLSARPAFDRDPIGISWKRSPSQKTEVDAGDDCQQNVKPGSVSCKDHRCGTFAAMTTSSRSPQTNRMLMDSSPLRGRQLYARELGEEKRKDIPKAERGDRIPPVSDQDLGRTG